MLDHAPPTSPAFPTALHLRPWHVPEEAVDESKVQCGDGSFGPRHSRPPDDLKLRPSITLFLAANPPHPAFARVLHQYYGGVRDPLTTMLPSTPTGER